MATASIQYAQLICLRGNIGDEFQSLAAIQHLPQEPRYFIDREAINEWPETKPVTMIMNGWFSSNPNAWPPSPSINPIFVGFHVTDKFKPTVKRHVEYLKRFEPIGVRDRATGAFLESLGIKTETTFCLTLTLPKRERAPANGKVLIVDADNIQIPSALRKNSIRIHHLVPPLTQGATLSFARSLLEYYRDTASLVITKRLHAALPCIAMGIPVVFFGDPADERTAIVREVGCTIYDERLHRRGLIGRTIGAIQGVDWSPPPLNIDLFRERLTNAVAARLRGCELSQPVSASELAEVLLRPRS
jgi:Polysaccharide pyruvyl transferase